MDFLLCKNGPFGLSIHIPLEDISSQEEAITKAKDIALVTKEGITLGLFTKDAEAICGWKVMKDNKLREENIEEMQYLFGVTSNSFDFAKRQARERRKSQE